MSYMPHFYQQIERELVENILPFWMTHAVDHQKGGFYGALTNDLQVLDDVPRSCVLCARVLWTFSAAYQQFAHPEYLRMARHAYDYLVNVFQDHQHGGFYWSVDQNGQPENSDKKTYGQAFAIYGLAEYYAATGEPHSLMLAQQTFELLERHSADGLHGGYFEARNRDWNQAADMRLSSDEPNCPKSMNTHLHLVEAYARLYRLWPESALRQALQNLLEVMDGQVLDRERGAFGLFFESDWRVLSDEVSYGHDIEASWLLFDAARALGDECLLTRFKLAAIKIANAVYLRGRDADGALFYTANASGLVNDLKYWWPQAEALVGFFNAYRLSGDIRFLSATCQSWQVIQQKFVDRTYGEWYKVLDQSGKPQLQHIKTGPWECPYHNARACLELLQRLK